MIRSDVGSIYFPLRLGIAVMLVMAMMMLWVPRVQAQLLSENSITIPILLMTSDEKCNVGGYKVETRGQALVDAVTIEAAPDPRG